MADTGKTKSQKSIGKKGAKKKERALAAAAAAAFASGESKAVLPFLVDVSKCGGPQRPLCRGDSDPKVAKPEQAARRLLV